MRALLVVSSILFLSGPLASLSTATPAGTIYELDASSDQQIGCLDPCLCPVLMRTPVLGTFRLSPLGFDGLYQHYAVTDVSWTVPRQDGVEPVVGSGRYKVGGEVAVQQQMVLDLRIGSGDVQHFDSGLVSGGQNFPKIDVAVAVHGFFCWDTTFTIRAVPKTASVGESPALVELGAGIPNPFGQSTRFELTVRAAGRVTVLVQDARGRIVATLARDAWFETGPHAIEWNGRSDGGAVLGPGIYFVRATTSDGERVGMRSIVRLAVR